MRLIKREQATAAGNTHRHLAYEIVTDTLRSSNNCSLSYESTAVAARCSSHGVPLLFLAEISFEIPVHYRRLGSAEALTKISIVFVVFLVLDTSFDFGLWFAPFFIIFRLFPIVVQYV